MVSKPPPPQNPPTRPLPPHFSGLSAEKSRFNSFSPPQAPCTTPATMAPTRTNTDVVRCFRDCRPIFMCPSVPRMWSDVKLTVAPLGWKWSRTNYKVSMPHTSLRCRILLLQVELGAHMVQVMWVCLDLLSVTNELGCYLGQLIQLYPRDGLVHRMHVEVSRTQDGRLDAFFIKVLCVAAAECRHVARL